MPGLWLWGASDGSGAFNFGVLGYLLMWFVFHAVTPASQGLFQAGWFVESLLSQTLVVHLLRTARVPFFQSRPSLPLLLSCLAVVGTGMILPQTHVGAMIGMKPLPGFYYLWLLGVLVGYGFLVQTVKGWYIRRYQSWLQSCVRQESHPLEPPLSAAEEK
jgi:Mg2+-importing ATPase